MSPDPFEVPTPPPGRRSEGGVMEPPNRRISLMIREDQHERLSALNVNVSGLVRSLIDDHLSEYTITISVSEETADLYHRIVSNTGSTDEDVEPHLKAALKKMLRSKIAEMEKLHASIA
jgi:hypothetical protein